MVMVQAEAAEQAKIDAEKAHHTPLLAFRHACVSNACSHTHARARKFTP